MRYRLVHFLTCGAAALLAAPVALAADAPINGAAPSAPLAPPAPLEEAVAATPSVLIKADSPADAAAVATARGLTVKRAFPWIGWYELSTPPGTTSAGAAEASVAKHPDVDATDTVKPGDDLGFQFTPRDPFWNGTIAVGSGNLNGQWHLAKANFPAAFDKAKGTGVLIGVVDSEFFTEHPELASKIRNPRNFASGTPQYGSGDVKALGDSEMHGTHVTGIAAAATDNGLGGSGAGFDANVVPAKIRTSFTPGGGAAIDAGFVADLVEALGYMGTQNVAVVNLSLGGTRAHQPIADAIAALRAKGTTIVVAAGNNQQSDPNAPIFPASYPGAFAVANTNNNDGINPTSSNGDWVDIAAPGTDIIAPWDARSGRQESFPVNEGNIQNRYGIISGTSMAAPVVTGLVALIKSVRPDFTPDEVESVIQSTAFDLGSAGRDPQFGNGRIDANKAVAAAIAYVRPTPVPTPVPPAPPAPPVAPAGPPAPPAPPADTTAPAVVLDSSASLKGSREITVRFACSEACSGKVRIREDNKKAKIIASKTFTGAAGKKVVVKLTSSKALRPRVKVRVEIQSADAAGNLATSIIKRTLKR